MLPLHDERYAELLSCPRVAPPIGPGGADMRWLHVCEEPMSAPAHQAREVLTLLTQSSKDTPCELKPSTQVHRRHQTTMSAPPARS
jgi:hypothetical protein